MPLITDTLSQQKILRDIQCTIKCITIKYKCCIYCDSAKSQPGKKVNPARSQSGPRPTQPNANPAWSQSGPHNMHNTLQYIALQYTIYQYVEVYWIVLQYVVLQYHYILMYCDSSSSIACVCGEGNRMWTTAAIPGHVSPDKHIVAWLDDQANVGKETTAHQVHILWDKQTHPGINKNILE